MEDIVLSVLKVSDRCDRCGAQAYLKAILGESELMFCGHHGPEAYLGLIVSQFEIIDERYRILERKDRVKYYGIPTEEYDDLSL